MKYLKKYILVFCIFCMILVTGCSNTSSQITWADVNQKFMELEQERASVMDSIAKEKQQLSRSETDHS